MTTTVYDAAFYDRQIEGSVRSAAAVVQIVMSLARPKSVLDVGCGLGGWLAAFRDAGVERIQGVDGGHVDQTRLRIPREYFHAQDLGRPLETPGRFDLAMSLEVAEHLPAERAASFVEDLTSRAPLVLFSAAIPFQGGAHHVNEQWPSYWAGLFERHGFRPIDTIRAKVWRDPSVMWWYAQNTLLYASDELIAQSGSIRAEYDRCKDRPLDLVHPRKYLPEADTRQMSLRRSLTGLGFALRRRLDLSHR